MKRHTMQAIGYTSLGAALAIVAMSLPFAQAQGHPTPRVSKLLTQSLEELGKEVRMEKVDFPAGAVSPAHRHPGPVFVYVLEGEVISALGAGAEQSYKAGSSFYEPAGGLHAVAKNPSDKIPASILVFQIADKDKPSTVLDSHK